MFQKLEKGFKGLVLLALALFFLVACESADTANQSAEGNSDSSENSSESADGVTELSIFVDHTYWPLAEWSGAVPEEITEKTGVKLDVQVATDAQQLPLMISSGDLPDLVFTANNFDQMSDPDISYTWDELIEEYNVENFEIDPLARVLNQTEDGNLYAVKNGFTTPEEFESVPNALATIPAMSMRKDILEELGNPKIESLDDYVSVLESVKEKYPNMTPLVFSPAAIGQYFRVNFGVGYLHNFQLVDGEVKYYIQQPKQYDYYMFMNELYRKGLISPENFTWNDTNQAKAMVINGEAFAIANTTDAATINSEIKASGKDYSIEQLTELIGENPKLASNSAGWSGTFITKNTDNPEAAIKFLQFMQSEEGQKLGLWGIEGEHWTMDKPIKEGGYPTFTFDSQSAAEQKEIGAVWWGLLADKGIIAQVQRYVPDTAQTKALVNAKQYVENNPLLAGIKLPVESEPQIIKANLDNMIKNEETKIYLAESEEQATAAYESMMKLAEEIGIEKLNEYANQQYQELESELEEIK